MTKIFANLTAGKIKNPKTQQEYVNALNRWFNLDGEGCVDNRVKHKLVVQTIRHLGASNAIGTTHSKRGDTMKISCNFLKLVAFHVNMERVGVHGKMSTNQIKATRTATPLDTPHQWTSLPWIGVGSAPTR